MVELTLKTLLVLLIIQFSLFIFNNVYIDESQIVRFQLTWPNAFFPSTSTSFFDYVSVRYYLKLNEIMIYIYEKWAVICGNTLLETAELCLK